jgi:hypothetical protein
VNLSTPSQKAQVKLGVKHGKCKMVARDEQLPEYLRRKLPVRWPGNPAVC